MRYSTHPKGKRYSYRFEREIKRLERRRSPKALLVLVCVGALGVVVATEIGRAWLCMRRVDSFVSSLATRNNAQLRADLDMFYVQLSDRNPLVRSAAMAAMKLATGWQLGADANEWRQWWVKKRDTWEYHHTERPESPSELKGLLEGMTSPAPATVESAVPGTP